MMKRDKNTMSYERKKSLAGYVFISLWLIGVVWFFLLPLAQTVLYMFNDVKLDVGSMKLDFVGLKNIKAVLFEDATSIRLIVDSIGKTCGETVLIIVFSLFLAIVLNQNFKGRGLVRTIFVLPVIVSSGVLLSVFKNDLFVQSAVMSTGDNTIFQSGFLQNALLSFAIPPGIVSWMTGTVSNTLDVIWKSGVEIFLFLAGLQSISPSLYEVCDVEGSTAWQKFWKVTFPLMSPFILLNIVYAVIDSFTFYGNGVMMKVTEYLLNLKYSYGTALAFTYFIVISIVSGLALFIISKRVFYIEK